MKTRYSFALTALLATAAVAQTTVVQPDTFSHRATIELSGPGPFHQLALPLAVYQGMQQSDFGDLRVFNSQGEVVPYALLRKESRTISRVDETSVPLFPIVAPRGKLADTDGISVEVRKNADGTLVAVKQSSTAGSNGNIVRGVVLDASKIKGGVRTLRLTTGPSSTPFHAYTIETSDDLQQWRLLKSDAQLVRMEHDGQRIERNSTEWNGDAGKYLRVMWTNPEQAPAITAVSVGTMKTSFDQAPRIWSEPIVPTKSKDNLYSYALPGRMPLEQLRINLPQPNTLTQLQIQHYVQSYHRHRNEDHWETLTQTTVYRLQSPQGEVVSPEIDLHSEPESTLQLVVDTRSGGVGATPPTLQVGFVPHTLVFLGRGSAPFSLAWGAPSVSNTALDIGTLVPGYSLDTKLTASSATLKTSDLAAAPGSLTKAQQDALTPASKNLLWAVLIAGVLVLGGMAALLIKQMKQETPPRQE
ncbi:MAG TPA: DUF3999 domain-containing protein [Burkholderiaceae bacterium]|jgi:hypothetical protein